MVETIKEHLVSLGFQVDKSSYDKTTNAIDSINTIVSKFATRAVTELGKVAIAFLGVEKAVETARGGSHGAPGGNALNETGAHADIASKGLKMFGAAALKYFGEASLAIAGFATVVGAGTVKILSSLANQQIQMQMLARQLWTTQTQAQAFSFTLKALGANLQDLYLSPTLMAQYNQLHAVALKLQTPGDYTSAIGLVQSVKLQFAQLKLEAYYALQWVGYYFIKYMSGPITKVKNVLQSINDVIIKNMPTWTKHVAQVMASFVQAGIRIGGALGSVYDWLKKMLSYMPGWSKGIVAALAALGVAALSNPFMLFIEIVGAALLVLDDFLTYIHGGKSEFGPFWKSLIDGFQKLRKEMQANGTISNFISIFESLGTIIKNVSKWFVSMVKTLSSNGAFKAFISSVESLVISISNLFASITNTKNTDAMRGFGQLMTSIIGGTIRTLAGAIQEVASFIQVATDALNGNWKAAGKDIADIWSGKNLQNVMNKRQWLRLQGATGPKIGPLYTPHPVAQTSTTSSSRTVNAPLQVTQHIHGSVDPKTAARHWYSGFGDTWSQAIDAFKGNW